MDKTVLNGLLCRELMVVNLNSLSDFYSKKTILITGGGGTIGSEICRQISLFNPRKIIILDIHENSIYEIQQEIVAKYKNKIELVSAVASVRDKDRMDEIFCAYKPNIVFHAAAYKHLSLMENNPLEAICTNIFGTINVVDVCNKYKTEKLIFTSSDKAVNPTCIMGFTKKIAEIYLRSTDNNSNTSFVSVRFGNVIGSNGSVFSIFEKQIKRGGPLTITHPDVTRYFMAIEEACNLVMQVGVEAKGGEIYILDMKKPIKVVEIACRFASLHGYTVGEDIYIKFIGLKAGEKLDEELFSKDENVCYLSSRGLFLVKKKVIAIDGYWDGLNALKNIRKNDHKSIYDLLKGMC